MRTERGIRRSLLAALALTVTSIVVNYSTSEVPAFLAGNLWIAWTLTGLCVSGYLLLEFRPDAPPGDLEQVSARARRRYLRTALELDSIPVGPTVEVTTVEYGEGPQRRVLVPDRDLCVLPPQWSLAEAVGAGGTRAVDLRTALSEADLARATPLPHRFVVRGTSRAATVVVLHIITDLAYLQAVAKRPLRRRFAGIGLLDRGGILPYLDTAALHEGRVEVVGTVGTLGLVVAVECAGGRPVSRSRYLLVVRAGIRYPEDVWLSPATGRPLLSDPEPRRARVAFESPQPNGLATDVFACAVDGRRMVNLTRKDLDSYDGFGDGESAQWVDQRHLRVVSQLTPDRHTRIVQDPG
ncbi:hypothetical protein ACFOOK_17765 [Micromonospora krabiensis]|uniref:Uncharacterized protein n=1 Tax=Micromonospora krabiensis TaxID=307121 RepID=A0A1C3MZF5_9ACTN|nr:hypothetical protein [Micromonospora krabiensis]SBV25710.1 hypothetical protein GA0070620_1187 [Micromonospora krabiensis]